jgi:hypothetical protein
MALHRSLEEIEACVTKSADVFRVLARYPDKIKGDALQEMVDLIAGLLSQTHYLCEENRTCLIGINPVKNEEYFSNIEIEYCARESASKALTLSCVLSQYAFESFAALMPATG